MNFETTRQSIKHDKFTAKEQGTEVSITHHMGQCLVIVTTKDKRQFQQLMPLATLGTAIVESFMGKGLPVETGVRGLVLLPPTCYICGKGEVADHSLKFIGELPYHQSCADDEASK